MPVNGFRPEPRALAGALAVAMTVALGVGTATGQVADPEHELHELDRSLRNSETRRDEMRRRADRAAVEIRALKRGLVVTARRARDHERRAGEIELRLAGLEASEAMTADSLVARRGQLTATLAALQRLARQPAAAMLTLPADPTDTVRGAILMRAVVPDLDARARKLGAELRALAALRDDIAADRERLRTTATVLAEERRRLVALIRDKRTLERSARRKSSSAQARVAKLAARARTMRGLVQRLMAARGSLQRADMAPAPVLTPPSSGLARTASLGAASKVAGPSPLPATGRVVRRFAAAADNGAKTEGITIETRRAAHVVALRRGTVVFAGPFRGYGRLLIIEHDEGYHMLLAGLDRIDAVVGDEVLAGEPVGAMTASSNRTPELYLELRRSGRPINPLPWLAASKTKVSG
jgi:septal ring factor EnvC (AmiA/AmiB activator)